MIVIANFTMINVGNNSKGKLGNWKFSRLFILWDTKVGIFDITFKLLL